MSAEENKALVRRFFEARVKTDLNAVDKMVAPDFVSHTRMIPGQQPGREGLKQAITEISATMSNRRFFVEEQVAEADKVVTRFTIRATHDRGELMGVAPSGREASYKAIFIHRIVEGKIADELSLGTMGPKLVRRRLRQDLEQERIERERI